MGWNAVNFVREHPVLTGIANGTEFYFVHSYYPVPASEAAIIGQTEYAGVNFAAVTGCDNIVATQFHPEKSGRAGLQLLENFLCWEP